MAENDDTTTTQAGTQTSDASDSSDAPEQKASQEGDSEVSVLQSRFAGQTAKVNVLTEQKSSLETQVKTLQKQLSDAQSGVTTADEAAKALLQAKDDELAQLQKAIKVAELKGRFPEVFAELGEDAVSLSEEKLAAMEARFQGAGAGDSEPPTPRGQNAARKDGVPTGGREPKEASSDDILARMRSMALPPEWGGQG